LGVLGWAAAAASLAVAAFRLRRRPPHWLGFAAAAALLAALRLLEFPLGEGTSFGASVLAVGLAVVVFGPEVAACALAAATVAYGVVSPHPDWAAIGANLLVHAAALPWVLGAAYAALKKAFPSRAAGYVLAFALGAASGPLVALAAGGVAWIGGAAAPGAARGLLAAALATTAAEGVVAAWGYTLAVSRQYEGDGRAPVWAPRPWPGAFGLAVLALVVAAGIAPLVPAYGGAFGPMPAWGRAVDVPVSLRIVWGLATVGAAAAAAFLLSAAFGLIALFSGNKKTGAR